MIKFAIVSIIAIAVILGLTALVLVGAGYLEELNIIERLFAYGENLAKKRKRKGR